MYARAGKPKILLPRALCFLFDENLVENLLTKENSFLTKKNIGEGESLLKWRLRRKSRVTSVVRLQIQHRLCLRREKIFDFFSFGAKPASTLVRSSKRREVDAFWEDIKDGKLNARMKCDLTDNLSLKANAQLTNEPHMSHGMVNFVYKGKDFRTQFQLGNGALFGASYIQLKYLLEMYFV
uniref:Uncharacterized protein n=1 Tax=Nelumbo nucifera TaxID=4432 RepID=A0A822XIC6_NELNU|nr:TPA_asm: hypothetical protein HUJ06_021440 [Nelumbo nucifera]